jgi:hypothetical protein
VTPGASWPHNVPPPELNQPPDCRDVVMHRFGKGKNAWYGIPIHDGGTSGIHITYCPSCGHCTRHRQHGIPHRHAGSVGAGIVWIGSGRPEPQRMIRDRPAKAAVTLAVFIAGLLPAVFLAGS